MIGGLYEAMAAIEIAAIEAQTVAKAREGLSPEAFAKWEAERTGERRHRELCRAIKEAGEAARPRGLGLFW